MKSARIRWVLADFIPTDRGGTDAAASYNGCGSVTVGRSPGVRGRLSRVYCPRANRKVPKQRIEVGGSIGADAGAWSGSIPFARTTRSGSAGEVQPGLRAHA